MTGKEAAQGLRKLAGVLETIERIPIPQRDPLDEEQQIGAAAILIFLRDMLTMTEKEAFSRDELLVLLSDLLSDRELFTVNLATLLEE